MVWLSEAVQAEAGHTNRVCGREQKGQAMTEPGAFSSPAAGAVNRRRVHTPPPPGSMLVKHPLTGHFTSESRAACHQPQHDWPHYDGCTSFGIGDGPWITATAFLNDLSILQIRIAQFFFRLSWPCATRRKILR